MAKPAEKLNNVVRSQNHANTSPKNASTLLIIDCENENRILMGRRHMRHKFMPGKFVFPGGRTDYADHRALSLGEINPVTHKKLMQQPRQNGSKTLAKALIMTAIRETYEETGIIFGKTRQSRSSNSEWQAFYNHSFVPDLSALSFFARAITPPRRPRRYDTRFFIAKAEHIAHQLDQCPSGELEDLHWVTIDEAMGLELPPITAVILEELRTRLHAKTAFEPDHPVSFYYMQNGIFMHDKIS